MPETSLQKSFCRICQGYCAVEVRVENDRIVDVRGDRSDPLTRGFICFKGLQAIEQHHGSGRLTRSLRRNAAGNHEAIDSEDALREISDRLKTITERHGARSVAIFHGTQSPFQVLGVPMAYGFAKALGTPSLYGTMTIDQSAKWVADGRLGQFGSGPHSYVGADTWMLVGTNPLVSLLGGPYFGGFQLHNPVKSLKDAKKKGLRLIVVDPRKSDTARHADIHLQCRPGTDALLLAGLINIILQNDWHDREFCEQFIGDIETLRREVAPFTPELVATRADIDCELLIRAARLFARDSRTGGAGGGTGPDMGPHSNLSEHLIRVLNLVCGRFLRPGDRVPNPGVLTAPRDIRAEVIPPNRQWERGPRTLVHGLGTMNGQMMTTVLADEILYPKKGGVRALICLGSNPATALPDQDKALHALGSLDLLVTIDPRMSTTASLADYVIAPTLQYERPDHTGPMEGLIPVPYAHYTPALIAPAANCDVIDEWYFFWRIAQHLGLELEVNGTAIPMIRRPSSEELIDLLAQSARVPLETIKSIRGGRLYPIERFVEPASEARQSARFTLLPPDVLAELRTVGNEAQSVLKSEAQDMMRLTVRRQREVMNSFLTDFSRVRDKFPYPPAYLHPKALHRLGIAEGDRIELTTRTGRLNAHARADDSLRADVVSMPHCWPAESDVRTGSVFCTSRLVSSEHDVEDINRMPIMTGIPVVVRACKADNLTDSADAARA